MQVLTWYLASIRSLISEKTRIVEERERVIEEKERVIEEKERVIEAKDEVINEVRESSDMATALAENVRKPNPVQNLGRFLCFLMLPF